MQILTPTIPSYKPTLHHLPIYPTSRIAKTSTSANIHYHANRLYLLQVNNHFWLIVPLRNKISLQQWIVSHQHIDTCPNENFLCPWNLFVSFLVLRSLRSKYLKFKLLAQSPKILEGSKSIVFVVLIYSGMFYLRASVMCHAARIFSAQQWINLAASTIGWNIVHFFIQKLIEEMPENSRHALFNILELNFEFELFKKSIFF